jgi:hypothetical protein
VAEGRERKAFGQHSGHGKKLAEHPELIECLWLVKSGVPYDVAFSLLPEERFAYVVVMARFEGSEFLWDQMRWKER